MIRVRVGDAQHTALVRPSAEAVEVTLDGTAHRLAVQALTPGTFVLTEGTRQETFHVVRQGSALHVWWRGRTFVVHEQKEGARGTVREKGGGLETPMPGKVMAVKVTVGQDVKKGDEILVVEAMKMENVIRAPKDGRVKSLAAKVGDMVAPGVVLAEIE